MIEKVEIKLNKLKRKIDPRITKVAVFMILGALIIFSLEMANNFKRQKNSLQDEYNRSMYLAVSYINNVEVDLAKLLVTSTPKMNAITLADIWKQSNLAKESLEQIPVSQNALDNVSKYLTQVSDFSYSLMKQNIADVKISDEEYENIREIYTKSQELGRKMQEIYEDLNDGRVKWDELEKNANKELPNIELGTSLSSISEVGKAFQNYEGLIYDGAFSDHILSIKPRNTEDEDCTKEDARDYIEKTFSSYESKIKEIKDKEDSSGKIDLYNFDVIFNDEEKLSLSITKKGCKLYLMLGDKKVKKDNISIDDAKQKGLKFLENLGISNIKDTYYQKSENIAIINYAALQDDVVLYPDLIKVKIALDDGRVLGVESQGYIYNHYIREDVKPSISVEKAKQTINTKIEILSSDLVIIPTEYNSEILAYEFKGRLDGRDFLIYINAKNGMEERVLLIIDSKNGILTM